MGHGVFSKPDEKALTHAAEPAPELERETARPASSRRMPRRRSIRVARASRNERERALSRAYDLEQGVERPQRREDCAGGPRPCPYVACKHHLYLDVSPGTGTIKLNFPELEVWELAESCALDVADSGAQEVDHASHLLNVSRERIRQIEVLALSKLSTARDVRQLRDIEDFPKPPRALNRADATNVPDALRGVPVRQALSSRFTKRNAG